MARSKNKVEFGDFQTPPELASRVCGLIKESGTSPVSLIEPTCGVGNFVFSALEHFPSIKKGIALDINPTYTQIIKKRIGKDKGKVEIQTEDFFQFNWNKYIASLP